MCYAKKALNAAAVGVFAFSGQDGRPRACAVTPFLYDGEAVVTSTLAFTAKVAAVRRDARVALLAGGCLIRGRGTVDIDLTSKTFDERIRDQELRKYPPARQLLAIPGHRRLLWWYVGRASIAIPVGDPGTDVSGDEIPVPVGHESAACLLVHDEEPDMADLRQLTLHGARCAPSVAPPARTVPSTPAGPASRDGFVAAPAWPPPPPGPAPPPLRPGSESGFAARGRERVGSRRRTPASSR
jgi:hypothetical protein